MTARSSIKDTTTKRREWERVRDATASALDAEDKYNAMCLHYADLIISILESTQEPQTIGGFRREFEKRSWEFDHYPLMAGIEHLLTLGKITFADQCVSYSKYILNTETVPRVPPEKRSWVRDSFTMSKNTLHRERRPGMKYDG